MSTTATTPDRFTTLPDEAALDATVVALEEHGFSVEVVGDLDAARQAVLARIPEGSSVMTNTSVTLAQAGIADVINDGGGPWESARNRMFALDFATQAQDMKAIGGQADYALGSVHAGAAAALAIRSSEASSVNSARTAACGCATTSWSVTVCLRQPAVDERHGHRSLTDSRCSAFDRPVPHVTRGEHAPAGWSQAAAAPWAAASRCPARGRHRCRSPRTRRCW